MMIIWFFCGLLAVLFLEIAYGGNIEKVVDKGWKATTLRAVMFIGGPLTAGAALIAIPLCWYLGANE